MAPDAVQRAALQEDGGTNTRTVMQRSTLNVEDHTGNCHETEIQILAILIIMGYYTRFGPFSLEYGVQIYTNCTAANRVHISTG